MDVASNVGFLIAGAAGLIIVLGGYGHFEFRRERWPYAVFFLGMLLTAFGSSYCMVVLLLLAMLCPSRYTRGSDLYWVFAWYALSKLLETFDPQILAIGHVVSGHTLKHLAAAVSGIAACNMLVRRTLKDSEVAREPAGRALA